MMTYEAQAPANLALIKYMGKNDVSKNLPSNSSLSLTLDRFLTRVRLTEKPDGSGDQWGKLEWGESLPLDGASVDRFMNHFARLKEYWGIRQNFLVESANNFPSDCGLASSASAFAALTKAAGEAFQQMSPRGDFVKEKTLPTLSRLGSGSSCRSFGGPLVLWQEDSVQVLESPWKLKHLVVIVNSHKKTVSSSQAHRRVSTSLLFEGRASRAEQRLAELLRAFQEKNWPQAFELVWSDFMDMHALFETSRPSFGYRSSESFRVLEVLRSHWDRFGQGPWATMDAGANVHLIWCEELSEQMPNLIRELKAYRLLGDVAIEAGGRA